MSARPEGSIWPDLELDPVQNHNAHEGTRRTLPGWLSTMAKRMTRQKGKSYDDAESRRRRENRFPSIPGEEMRNGRLNMLQEWTSRDLEAETSIRSATGKENADRGMSNVLEPQTPVPLPGLPSIALAHRDPEPLPNPHNDLRRGSQEPPRGSHLDESSLNSASISDGTSKSTTVDILLTEAMR